MKFYKINVSTLNILIFVLLISPFSFAASSVSILGAGATFPAPIYQKFFDQFKKENPTIEITYNPIGSGGGIKNLKEQIVDFGASDAPLSDTEIKEMPKKVIHIPTVMGAVVVTQNLAGVTSIKLTGEVISQIYMGKIEKWNDPKIVALNKNIKLPDQDIVVVYRSDSSGTTAVFTEYLAKVSEEWKNKVGQGKAIKWPVGQGNKGNDGVASVVKNTPGAIGYVELVYAQQQKMAIDEIQNKSGAFVKASVSAVTAAANAAAKSLPEDLRVSITNAEGKDSYPISAFTYLLVYDELPKDKAQALLKLFDWILTKGQTIAPTMDYAALPKSVLAKVKDQIKQIH